MYPVHWLDRDTVIARSAAVTARLPAPRAWPAVLMLLVVSTAHAADWPQWLGPNRDGSSVETVAPWKGPPKVAWRQPVGEGHSSPVVSEGKVFLHTRVADRDEEVVTAYDALTGDRLWQANYPRGPFSSPFGAGPRATPAVRDKRVYTYGVTGVLSCLNADDGRRIWRVGALDEFKASNLLFGASCSPLPEGETVIVNVGGRGASVVAFRQTDGRVAWKSLDDGASYSSPIAFGAGKDRQVLQLTQRGLVALDPAAGRLLWRFPFVDRLSESSTTPLHLGDKILASSVTLGSVGLKLTRKDGKPRAEQVWKNSELTCYFSTPVAVGPDHVYLVTGRVLPPPESTLQCVELATGKVLWKRPKTGRYHAALLRTGNNKLLLLDDNGDLALFEPDPGKYRELARSRICGQTWAHPALANGRLYLRDDKELICLELPAFN